MPPPCGVEEENKKLWKVITHLERKVDKRGRAIEGALRIKSLWLFDSDEPEHAEESKALATMYYSFQQALPGEEIGPGCDVKKNGTDGAI
ncbi:unnamed protein product [marine sediment metagenome]|uniref:Uncharacterized protein n=1 Tax=marine sediment metagenome TaxID=412755 RepID=X1S290_9ZZZZ